MPCRQIQTAPLLAMSITSSNTMKYGKALQASPLAVIMSEFHVEADPPAPGPLKASWGSLTNGAGPVCHRHGDADENGSVYSEPWVAVGPGSPSRARRINFGVFRGFYYFRSK